ncbi:MAG: hypothetical protein HC785_09285 [Calothrix sp. CSU_2_0]|nr:hypothetical protein [Calothrix sp. CSU_2_0]
MKGQYLFYSLLPGVTVTLLGIQPSFADSVQVEEANFDFWNFVISRKVTSQTDVSANV